MSSSERDVPVFAAMLGSARGDRVSERETLPAILAENVEIEHPCAPDRPRRIVGSATLVAHLRATLARFIFTVERVRRHTIPLSL